MIQLLQDLEVKLFESNFSSASNVGSMDFDNTPLPTNKNNVNRNLFDDTPLPAQVTIQHAGCYEKCCFIFFSWHLNQCYFDHP